MPTITQWLGGKACLESHNGIRAILDCYRAAEPIEYRDGLSWYTVARAELRKYAKAYGYSLDCAAAVCARLSPQTAWADNLEATHAILQAVASGKDTPPIATCYPYNIHCATEIAIADKHSRAALKEAIAEYLLPQPKRPRPKISAFYDNLYRASSVAVTVDTWALRIWLGDCAAPAVTSTPKQIARIADDYRAAALRVGLRGYQLQAITWVAAHRLARGPNGLLPFDIIPKL